MSTVILSYLVSAICYFPFSILLLVTLFSVYFVAKENFFKAICLAEIADRCCRRFLLICYLRRRSAAIGVKFVHTGGRGRYATTIWNPNLLLTVSLLLLFVYSFLDFLISGWSAERVAFLKGTEILTQRCQNYLQHGNFLL